MLRSTSGGSRATAAWPPVTLLLDLFLPLAVAVLFQSPCEALVSLSSAVAPARGQPPHCLRCAHAGSILEEQSITGLLDNHVSVVAVPVPSRLRMRWLFDLRCPFVPESWWLSGCSAALAH